MFKIILPVFMILASIASFIFYTNDKYKEAQVSNIKLEKISDALKKANQLQGVRDALGEKYKQIPAADLERLTRMLPNSVENIGLIIELNNIANDKGLELLSPSISESSANSSIVGPDSKKYGSIGMTFSINSTYERFLDFLQELERSLRLVDVTNLSFTAPDAKTGRSNFSVTLQTYWLKN